MPDWTWLAGLAVTVLVLVGVLVAALIAFALLTDRDHRRPPGRW